MVSQALLRITLAAVVGLIIGYFSGGRNNIRIFIFITVGAALVTITSVEFFKLTELPWSADPGRLAAQVIVALSFLGTGLIWISDDSKVKGLPIVASLLISAVMGILIGMSNTRIILSVIFILLLLYLISLVVSKVELKLRNKRGPKSENTGS